MDRNIFNSVMKDLWGNEIDISEAWDTYNETITTLNLGSQLDVEVLEMLPKMNRVRRLQWRMSLSEQGIEMPPHQVDQYISIIELALGK